VTSQKTTGVLTKLLLARADLDMSVLQDFRDNVWDILCVEPHDVDVMCAFLAHPGLCMGGAG